MKHTYHIMKYYTYIYEPLTKKLKIGIASNLIQISC